MRGRLWRLAEPSLDREQRERLVGVLMAAWRIDAAEHAFGEG